VTWYCDCLIYKRGCYEGIPELGHESDRCRIESARWPALSIRRLYRYSRSDKQGITFKMHDLDEELDKFSQRKQHIWQSLHGLLSRLRAEIPRDKKAAYVLWPLRQEAAPGQKSWELFELDREEPAVKGSLAKYEAKFPAHD